MWQLQVKFCPLCGAPAASAPVAGRDRTRCSSCTFVHYENPACVAAGVVLDDARRVLLIRRALEPCKGKWALPAGYQEPDESAAATAVRETFEESGLIVRAVELFDLLFIPAHARRAANLAVFLCQPIGGVLRAGDDALDAAWFDLDGLPSDMGFDNGPAILDRLRTK